MFPKPLPALTPDTFAFEELPLVKPMGFREYDARWLFPDEINLMGVLGLGIGTLAHELSVRPDIVTGHDFRAYSSSIKLALIAGVQAAGLRVKDVGLALSPMAYFGQFALDCPCVAMVTASHNDNGWTSVKMGANRPMTFGLDEMGRLKEIVLDGTYQYRDGGAYEFVEGFAQTYLNDLKSRAKPLSRKLKVVAACGTAGAFAPKLLEALGVEVIPLDVTPDYTFPRYNPNPEDMAMLHAIAHAVKEHGADVGLGFDGDGDRCGVVDDEGAEIFADKIGVMLARDLGKLHPGATFVVDVKSTGLYLTNPELKAYAVKTDYWKTGHSYIKRQANELGALAGFEKSGHFFFNAPIGRGYDDGLLTAIAVIEMLDLNPERSMADLYRALPKTWGSPTMSPHCADEAKYGVVDTVTARFRAMKDAGEPIAGSRIVDLITLNGVRITTEDGTWGLMRASSNKPELVVVIERPASEARVHAMFAGVDAVLRENAAVGSYNQTILSIGSQGSCQLLENSRCAEFHHVGRRAHGGSPGLA